MSDTTYMIAKLNNVYMPDLQCLGSVRFVQRDDGQDAEYFETLGDAKTKLAELNHETYVTVNGESDRPDYYIVDDNAGDWINSGRNGDLSNYDWDGCDCDKNDGDCCGECSDCISHIIEQDRQYIIKNAIGV